MTHAYLQTFLYKLNPVLVEIKTDPDTCFRALRSRSKNVDFWGRVTEWKIREMATRISSVNFVYVLYFNGEEGGPGGSPLVRTPDILVSLG